MSNIADTVSVINSINALAIVTDDLVKSQFIQIYDQLWGTGNGSTAYERESHYFNKILSDDTKLQTATNFSIYQCFIDLAICGLSLKPGSHAQCYLIGRNKFIGEANGKKQYEGRLTLSISGYGELAMRKRSGQIKYVDNPVLVYDEDDFGFDYVNGTKQVNYRCNLPHTSNHIRAAFMKITRPDGTVDYGIMNEEDWERLAGFSADQNKRWDKEKNGYVGNANPLYTNNNGGIDSGFLIAKLLKHTFNMMDKEEGGRKIVVGRNSELVSNQNEIDEKEIDDFYNLGGVPAQPTQPTQPQQQSPFSPSSVGVTVAPAQTPSNSDECDDDGAF